MSETPEHPLMLGAGLCPFCGGAPIITGTGIWTINRKGAPIITGTGLWTITCKACYASTGQQHTDTEAVAAWNRRPDKLSKTKDRWITNAANHEVGDVMAILTRGQHGRVLRVGDPEPTSFYTAAALSEMGVVGIYEVLT